MKYKLWEKKSDYVIRIREYMRYIGVFALDGDLIAHSGAPGVQQIVSEGTGISGTETARVLNIKVEQRQAKAVVNHIKDPGVNVARINIANLHFLCFKHGTGNMVGMSNFNIENSEQAIREMDKAYFRISRRHFTRSDSLDSHHVLNIAATLWKDIVIIGIGLPSKSSCLSAVQELTKPDIPPTPKSTLDKTNTSDVSMNPILRKPGKSTLTDNMTGTVVKNNASVISLEKEPMAGNVYNRRESDEKTRNGETIQLQILETIEKQAEVEKSQDNRRRTKSVDDIDDVKDYPNYDIEDERIKSATIRSIEALRNIGPFTDTLSTSEGEGGSAELLRSKSTEMLIEKKKRKPQKSRPKSVSSADAGSKLNRRPSRATMV